MIPTIRRIDDLGRIVIPKEIRAELGIQPGDELVIWENMDTILIQNNEPRRANDG